MRRLAFCLTLSWSTLFSPLAFAEYDSPLLSAAVGLKVGNKWIVRGARFYDALTTSPVVYLGAFDRRLEFFGNSLEFNDFLLDGILRGRTKVSFFGDEPAVVYGQPKGFRNSRETALELTQTLQWFIPDWDRYLGQWDFSIAKEIKEHFGVYLETTARLNLHKFHLSDGVTKLIPQAFVRFGFGDGQHNRYLYGQLAPGSGGAGLNHFAVGFMVVAPPTIDPHYPILELGYYRILGDFRNGLLVVDKPQGIALTATFAMQVFEIK